MRTFNLLWIYMIVLASWLFSCKTQEETIDAREELDNTTEIIPKVPEGTDYKDHKSEAVEVFSEDIEMAAPRASHAKPTAMMAMSRADASSYDGSPRVVQVAKNAKDLNIDAGQLTAGEWNDLHNWEAWNDLLENSDYVEMQDHWGIYPNSRISVFVRNQYEFPIQDAVVNLIDKNERVIWQAKTDNSGKAELWPGWTDANNEAQDLRLIVKYKGQDFVKGEVKDIGDGVNHINIKDDCDQIQRADIFFAVDATGSMGDEINYLQSELEDVITRTSIANTELNMRTGAVFYRDHTDDYLTKKKDLNEDHEATLSFIAEQTAQGGGDYPEALDAALSVALDQQWSKEAIARIVFLLLDAPPHEDSSSLRIIQGQIKEAAAKGIKIIPITASGINRQTEFLMKYMAMGTNGTYVFITDDSGIGHKHLDPVVKDYEVEKLNDLIVRLLKSYTSNKSCDIQKHNTTSSSVKIFPNPTSNFITISNTDKIERIKILSPSGKVIISRDINQPSDLKIDLSGWVDGMYNVLIEGPDYNIVKSVVKVRG